MKRYFSYNRTSDEVFNSLIDSTLDLARQTYEGRKSANYLEQNNKLLNAMGQKIVEGTRFEADYAADGLAIFNRPMVKTNGMVRDNFNMVISQVVTAIVPEVVND